MAMTKEQQDRYNRAAHRFQSAIKYEIETLGAHAAAADPKHRRVGINSAMAEHYGLAKLLIARGVITESEYLEAVVVAAEEEADRVVAALRQKLHLPLNVDFA